MKARIRVDLTPAEKGCVEAGNLRISCATCQSALVKINSQLIPKYKLSGDNISGVKIIG